jgi:hypothetical protein
VGERLRARVAWAAAQGCPVAGADAAAWASVADVAARRWASFSRRHGRPGDDTAERRVEDLARGLRDRFEAEPALTGPLMADYRWLAARLAEVLAPPAREDG